MLDDCHETGFLSSYFTVLIYRSLLLVQVLGPQDVNHT